MGTEIAAGYPSKYETEILLKDGSRVLLRPIRKDDTRRWLAFVNKLSFDTRYLRFHYVPKEMSMEDAVRFCTVDYSNTFAFVAEVTKGKRREIVAIGRYYRLPDKHSAEIGIVIGDAYQGKGLGTNLIKWLVRVARANGITSFEADILATNEKVMTFLGKYGFLLTRELKDGVYHITFPIKRREG
jgi:RimJ/RimL family protein N-acetyltransferase